VLSRKPDLVLFNLPTGSLRPKFRSGKEMMDDPRAEFTSTFVPVEVACRTPRPVNSVIWMRTEGGAVGIRRSEDRIEIPGYLFAIPGRSRAILDGDSTLDAALVAGSGVQLPRLLVPPGKWLAHIDATGGPVALSIVDPVDGSYFTSGGSGSSFSMPAATSVALLLWAQEPSGAHVREVVLERVGAPRAVNAAR